MHRITLRGLKELDFRRQEAYNTLRSNLEFCGKKNKVIEITSCAPDEGKSTVAVYLAKSIADNGKKVMLLDADLRKSALVEKYQGGGGKSGLSNFLSGQMPFEDIYFETDIPNLYITFAGPIPPNPSELLGSPYFQGAVDTLRRTFDYVIIDTPPLENVIDAAVIASCCDGYILVVEDNRISYRFAQQVKEQLDRTGCRNLGCVLNKVNMSGKGYNGRFYRKYGKYSYDGGYYGRTRGKAYPDNAMDRKADEPG